MVKEAETHAEEDKKKKEMVELDNQADTLIYTTEQTLKEHGDKISDDDKKKVKAAIESLKKAVEDKDAEAIKSGMEQVTQSSHKLAEVMYAQAQAAQQAAGAAGAEGQADDANAGADAGAGASQDEDVVDADFEVVDEDKKE